MAEENKKIDRRSILKGLAGLPILGSLGYLSWAEAKNRTAQLKISQDFLNINAIDAPTTGSMAGDIVKLGVIGAGLRGIDLMRAAGFATSDALAWKNSTSKRDQSRYNAFIGQDDLNVRFAAICDIADFRIEPAYVASTTNDNKPQIYRRYEDLLADDNVDAVIIATSDHWHAPMAIDALKAGKHVYLEKCMTHKIGETFELEKVAKSNPDLVFQVGHQHRQTQSFLTAQDIVRKNVLGHINLVDVSTNRNSDNGAWQYDLMKSEITPKTLDWDQFLGNAPKIPFNLEHYRRWRKWWSYGSGITGDLLTHDFDRINCVMSMGIPTSVMASGGIYAHRDGRTVPDVLQVAMEFPDYFMGSSQALGKEKGMSFIYSASLGNSYSRPTMLMGHDATMELGKNLTIYPDVSSTRYHEQIEAKIISESTPMFEYDPSKLSSDIDGISGATSKYFADKGLLYTYRDGKRVDSTHLHIREWVSCIRHQGKPSCGIKEGFEEAICAHMASVSYKTGKRVEWDKKTRQFSLAGIPYSYEELDRILSENHSEI